MLAECVKAFMDLETGDLREKGERFDVTADRLAAINSTKYGQLAVEVEQVVAEAPTEAETPKPRRTRTRKAKAEE